MRIILSAVAAVFAVLGTPALAQVNAPASSFPSPAVGEFGPREAAPDGLVFNDHLDRNGDPSKVPATAAPDNNGAFRFICMAGQNSTDDPVVYPGQKGKSHGHQFYGNTGTNWLSNYDNQRATGDSTCQNPLNRTGYWVPDIRLPNGQVQRPEYISIYYKREPKGSPECTPGDPKFVGICVGIPNALRFIFGTDLVSFTTPTGSVKFKCVSPDGSANRSEFKTSMVEAASFCQMGSTPDNFDLVIEAPTCWNGVDLDSPNHRSHVAYLLPNYKCPSTHPYYMAHFTLQAFYKVNEHLNRSGAANITCATTWCFSSDIDFKKAPGTTMHADYFEGWNPKAKKAWQDNCIDKLLTCTGGEMGNGFTLRQEWPLTGVALPRYIRAPAKANEPFSAKIGHRH